MHLLKNPLPHVFCKLHDLSQYFFFFMSVSQLFSQYPCKYADTVITEHFSGKPFSGKIWAAVERQTLLKTGYLIHD